MDWTGTWQTVTDAAKGAVDWLRRGGKAAMDTMTGRTDVTWPPKAHAERVRMYRRNELLYQGAHEQVFPREAGYGFKFTHDTNVQYLVDNLLGALTDRLAWRLCGESIRVQVADADREESEATQAFLDDLNERNGLAALHLLAAQTGSYRGDIVYKLRREGAAVKVELEDPAGWVPEGDPLDNRRMVASTFGKVVSLGDGHTKQTLLWLERYQLAARDGEANVTCILTNTLFRCSVGQSGQVNYDPLKDERPLETVPWLASLPPEADMGIDVLPVVHIANKQAGKRLWPDCTYAGFGASDYLGLETIQGELNNRRTRLKSDMDKTVPIGYGPRSPSVVNEKGEVKFPSGALYIPTEGTESGPPVAWAIANLQTAPAETECHDLVVQFAAEAGIAIGSLIPPEGGGPVSGKAIRMSEAPTQATVRGKQLGFAPGLQAVYSIATKLVNSGELRGSYTTLTGNRPPAILQPEELSVEFGDGLPPDSAEDIQDAVAAYGGGIMSLEEAVRTAHSEWNGDQVQAEVARIREDLQATAAPPEPSGTTGGSVEIGPGSMAERLGLTQTQTEGTVA